MEQAEEAGCEFTRGLWVVVAGVVPDRVCVADDSECHGAVGPGGDELFGGFGQEVGGLGGVGGVQIADSPPDGDGGGTRARERAPKPRASFLITTAFYRPRPTPVKPSSPELIRASDQLPAVSALGEQVASLAARSARRAGKPNLPDPPTAG